MKSYQLRRNRMCSDPEQLSDVPGLVNQRVVIVFTNSEKEG
jgi:hypothetical protein